MRKLLVGSLFAFLALASAPAVEPAAQAQTEIIRIQVAPPALRVETIPPAPTPQHVWLGGHWMWNGSTHVWVGGRWEVPHKPGWQWYPARWINEGGGYYVFVKGHWGPPPALPPGPVVEIATPPPPPQDEVIRAAPSPEHFFIPGHWRWDPAINRHVWEPGRWELKRVGQVWEPARWVRIGPTWRYVPGHWRPW
jgi:hypothetical protein